MVPFPATPLQTLAAAGATVLAYPLVWYALHRWVLHSKWMFKSRLLAPTWKRIHYDHHQDPNHLEVLFGALHTTLPTIAVGHVPIGWAIGGIGGAAAAFGDGPADHLLLRVHALHPAPGVQAEVGSWSPR